MPLDGKSVTTTKEYKNMLRIAHQAPLSYISFYYDVTDAPPNHVALSCVQSTDAPSIFLFSINTVY